MSLNPSQLYQQNSVDTASPGELTLMLYNGIIKFTKLARYAMEEKNIQEKNINIQKAQAILRELMITLRMDVPVAKDMMKMYDYMQYRLIDANIKNDVAILDEVEGYAVEFRDTWKQIIQVTRQQNYGSNGKSL